MYVPIKINKYIYIYIYIYREREIQIQINRVHILIRRSLYILHIMYK